MSNGFLFTVTSVVDFVILVTSVWMGLYILTRNPQKKISWLVCGILWSLGGSFLNALVFLHAPPDRGVLPWWWGWGIPIAVAFWFHLSVTLLSRRLNWKWRWSVILVYFITLNLVAMQTYTNLIYENKVLDLPLTHNVFHPGTFYPLFSLFEIFTLAISVLNFWRARWTSKIALLRRYVLILLAASCLAFLGLIYEFLSIGYGLATPIWPGDLCLGLGAAFLGYGILHINAIREGKVVGRDFLFSFIATALVVVAYLLAAFFSRMTLGVPFVAFIFIILLAIASHSLVDWGRERLEKVFYRSKSHPELRHELREFSRTTTSDHDLHERLSTLLKTLCQTLGVKGGLIALREGDEFLKAVDWNGDELDHDLEGDRLFGDEIQVLEPQGNGTRQSQSSAIIPLVIGGKQIGAIVLGHATPAGIFSEDDLEILEVFADAVSGVIYGIRLQEEKWEHIQGLMDEIHEREKHLQSWMRGVLVKDELHPYLDLENETEAISEVEDALRHLNDFATLGDHPLVQLNVIGDYLQVDRATAVTHLDLAKALHQLLTVCIEKLKPLTSMPSPPSKEWHQYVILHECYVEGALNRAVMGMLYIGEGTFHRARRKAVKAITRVLAEMERNHLEEAWSE